MRQGAAPNQLGYGDSVRNVVCRHVLVRDAQHFALVCESHLTALQSAQDARQPYAAAQLQHAQLPAAARGLQFADLHPQEARECLARRPQGTAEALAVLLKHPDTNAAPPVHGDAEI